MKSKPRINVTTYMLITMLAISALSVVICSATETVKITSVKNNTSAVKISATVDKPKITIGDKITYTVNITHDRKCNPVLPEIADTLQQFEIKDYEIKNPRKRRGKLIHEFNYLITTFTTGEFSIKPFVVKWKNSEGKDKKVESGEIAIFVESVKPSESDSDDIRDLKAPLNIKHSAMFYLLWIVTPLLLLIGFSVYYFTKKVKEAGFFSVKEPLKPADQMAYERLEKLKDMNLVEKGDMKQHYIILSEIIRKYMKARYDIMVLDMTTYELYQQLRKIGADKKHSTVIKNFLEECDMVKFAKYKPENNIINSDFETAKKIVDITRNGIQPLQEKSTTGSSVAR